MKSSAKALLFLRMLEWTKLERSLNQNTDRAIFYILMLVAFILKFSRDHNSWIRGIIAGKRVQVIKDGIVLVGNCMKAGISAN